MDGIHSIEYSERLNVFSFFFILSFILDHHKSCEILEASNRSNNKVRYDGYRNVLLEKTGSNIVIDKQYSCIRFFAFPPIDAQMRLISIITVTFLTEIYSLSIYVHTFHAIQKLPFCCYADSSMPVQSILSLCVFCSPQTN